MRSIGGGILREVAKPQVLTEGVGRAQRPSPTRYNYTLVGATIGRSQNLPLTREGDRVSGGGRDKPTIGHPSTSLPGFDGRSREGAEALPYKICNYPP